MTDNRIMAVIGLGIYAFCMTLLAFSNEFDVGRFSMCKQYMPKVEVVK